MKILSYVSLLLVLLYGCSHKKEESKKKVAESEISTLIEAYEYGFPLVLMDLTKQVGTNVAEPDPASGRAPINQFVHMNKLPTDEFKDIVRPNLDTLYSSAWLDLSKEPLVLELPDTNDRYYLMPLLDGWTNVIKSPGKRTTGTDAKKYVIVGPNWKGDISPQYEVIRSPTNMTWILGRTQVNGKKDISNVAKIQSGYKLYPLSSIGKTYFPPKHEVDISLSGVVAPKEVYELSTDEFFNRLNQLMVTNPPAPEDKPFLDRIKHLGIAPGATFDSKKLSGADQMAIERLPLTVKEKLQRDRYTLSKPVNGWLFIRNTGVYGTRYHERAVVAHAGLGANLDEDAIYPMAAVDKFGDQLTGKKNYRLHFEKNELPPANAFWSLTVYGEDNFLVKNPIDRFALGDRDNLKYNADGSLDIYIGHRSPGKNLESNWLPAPAGDFDVTARLYWPKEEALDSKWTLPPLAPVSFQNLSSND